MTEFMSWIGIVLLACFFATLGAVWSRDMDNRRCAEGKPVVIEGKVYRCKEVQS